MSVPQKYRAIGDFHEYYSGARTAPYLTLFVGGNHEASSHLHELYYGGWVAPKIYYLGAANVIRFGDLRIAGLSGIWKGYNYNKPHFERVPYTADEIKSLYHVREIDVRKLLLMRSQVDVGISHDWPRGIEWHGDYKSLFRQKDLFEADAKAGTLGSSAAKYVLNRLRPPWWFAAHLHCKFAATIDHSKEAVGSQAEDPVPNGNDGFETEGFARGDEKSGVLDDNAAARTGALESSTQVRNSDEIDLEMDEDLVEDHSDRATIAGSGPSIDMTDNQSIVSEDVRSQLPASFTRPTSTTRQPTAAPPPLPSSISNKTTRFLALDKCLPYRKFLQILDVAPLSPSTPPAPLQLAYDPEWLSILRVFGPHDPHGQFPSNLGEAIYQPLITKQREWVDENLVKPDRLNVPENFEITAPIFDGRDIRSVGREQGKEYTNPQTSTFCELLEIPNHFHASEEERAERRTMKEAQIEAERLAGGGREGGGRGGGGRGRGSGRGPGFGGRDGNRGRGRGRGWR